MEIKGLDDLVQALDDIGSKASHAANGRVPMSELLTPEFVGEHTRFANAEEMFLASGHTVDTQEEFEAIPDDQWDEFIRSESSFPDWKSMLGQAGAEMLKKKLGL